MSIPSHPCGLQTLNPHSGQINNVVEAMPAHTLAAMATTPVSIVFAATAASSMSHLMPI